MKYVTRIAPSPTGDFHLGTGRTAYFNWLAARASHGAFILRIDDTDLERSDPKYNQIIVDTLDWLGMTPDYSFKQSERFDLYLGAAEALVRADAAYKDDGCIRLRASRFMPETWPDRIAGNIKVTESDIKNTGDLVIFKSDGSPTYHFASVYDDASMRINLIIRGVDHISNTAKQIAIWRALNQHTSVGSPIPEFAHVGLIHMNKKKLSKRDGAASLLTYREQGIHPDAMCNFMLRLGWGPKNEGKEHAIIDKTFAKQLFLDGGNMRSSSANMDLNHLTSYDRKYKQKAA